MLHAYKLTCVCFGLRQFHKAYMGIPYRLFSSMIWCICWPFGFQIVFCTPDCSQEAQNRGIIRFQRLFFKNPSLRKLKHPKNNFCACNRKKRKTLPNLALSYKWSEAFLAYVETELYCQKFPFSKDTTYSSKKYGRIVLNLFLGLEFVAQKWRILCFARNWAGSITFYSSMWT